MSWVTPTDFSKVRNVTPQAVLKAIKTGRLKNSVRKNEKDKWEVNPEAAQLEWEANTDKKKQHKGIQPANRPLQPALFYTEEEKADQLAISDSRLMRERYEGLHAKLKYDTAAGKYVEAEEVKSAWFKIVTESKTKLLGLPTKAKAVMPHLSLQDITTLDRLVREALEDLSHDIH